MSLMNSVVPKTDDSLQLELVQALTEAAARSTSIIELADKRLMQSSLARPSDLELPKCFVPYYQAHISLHKSITKFSLGGAHNDQSSLVNDLLSEQKAMEAVALYVRSYTLLSQSSHSINKHMEDCKMKGITDTSEALNESQRVFLSAPT